MNTREVRIVTPANSFCSRSRAAARHRVQSLSSIVTAAAWLTLSFLSTTAYAAALPDLQNVAKPAPEPDAPSGWDVFTPPVTTSPAAANTPTIAEWTRTGVSDDTLILTGDKLSSYSGSDEGKDTQFLVYGQTSETDSAQAPGLIQRLDGLKAAVTLPMGLPAWSTYLLWPKNSVGYGNPVTVNRTEAWWVGPDQATRGDTVSVYGRNLSHDGGTTTSWVYIKPAGATASGQWVTVTSVNPYRVQFTLPASLSNGTYEVWIHNGHGGIYGWSGSLTLTITAPETWSGQTFNVKDSIGGLRGATGDGSIDDTDAIYRALSAAEVYLGSTGQHPTLYFPEGVYMLRQGLPMASNIRFRGDGLDKTVLRCNEHFLDNASLGIFNGQGGLLSAPTAKINSEVRDMTLDASTANGNNPLYTDPEKGGAFWVAGFSWDTTPRTDQRFVNVRFIALPKLPSNRLQTICVDFTNARRVSLINCEFDGGIVGLVSCRQVNIDQCTFLQGQNQLSSIDIVGSPREICVTGTRTRDQDETHPAEGRFITQRSWGFGGLYYIANNTTTNMGYGPGGNSGEQILNEGDAYTYYVGKPSSATTNSDGTSSITFPDLSKDYTGDAAVITAGKGVGQYREITGYNSATNTITVTPAWNVTPDANSQINIGGAASKWVIYKNSFKGKPGQNDYYTGSSGIQPWGLCYEWTGDSNTLSNFRIGINDSALSQNRADDPAHPEWNSPKTVAPSWFNLYINNKISSCVHGFECNAELPSLNQNEAGVGSLGTIFRNNVVSDLSIGPDFPWFYYLSPAGIAISSGTVEGAAVTPVVDDIVVEHNTFTSLPQGVDQSHSAAGGQIRNTIYYKNGFTLGSADFTSSYGAALFNGNTPALLNNTWTGFETTYTGTLSGAILEVPIRDFDVLGTSGGAALTTSMTLRNAGTASLNWKAASDSSWLTLSAGSGTIANENSASTVSLTCNPASLSPGTYAGTVTITGASQSKKVTVVFTTISTPLGTIIDPGFESLHVGTNNYNAFLYGPSIAGWTFTGGAGLAGNNSGFTSGNPNAPEGTQVAFIQDGGAMSQNVAFSAGTYVISAQVANRANSGGQQTVLVYVDERLVGTFRGSTTYSTALSNAFTVTNGLHSIRFVGLATVDSTLFLDQIAIKQAVPVGNSGFETPNVGSGAYFAFQYNPATTPGIQDWTFSGNSGVTGNGSGFTSGNSGAPEGTQVAFLQTDTDAISQSLSFPVAGIYTLSVSSARRGNWNEAPQLANVYLDNVLVGTFSPTSSAYQTFTLSVPASPGTHLLRFKGTVSSDSTLFIDRVALTLLSPL